MTRTLTILAAVAAAALATSSAPAQGTFTPGAALTSGLDAGFVGNSFTVTAPDIPSITGKIETRYGATGAAGTVLFLSGSMGQGWWTGAKATLCNPFFDKLIAADYDLVQVRWNDGGWPRSPIGSNLGQHALAQRPATAIKAVAAMRRPGRFIVLGSSNGSTQLTYSLALYNAASVIDLAIPVSGPPYMAICDGCQQVAGYAYPSYAANFVDGSYGYKANTGPCYTHNANWYGYEKDQSVDTGGVYFYGNTKVRVHYGQGDDEFIKNRAIAYHALLLSNNQPGLTITPTPKTGHSFQSSQTGLDTLFTAIIMP